MPSADPNERRRAPDGISYTRGEFIQFYGGLNEWNAAKPDVPLMPPPSSLNAFGLAPPPTIDTSAFAGLGLGSMSPPGRMQAAFSPPNAFGQAPSGPRVPPMPAPSPPKPMVVAAPKKPLSAADYAAAAQSYKPPPSKGDESMNSVQNSALRTTEAPKKALDWDCPRCTFKNKGALAECDMCGFTKPGKPEAKGAVAPPPRAVAAADDGWQTASKQRGPAPPQTNAQGKTKAQAKNEKRRAKK